MSKNQIHMRLDEIRAVLSAHGNQQKADQMEAYMKGHFKFYGIPSVQRRGITKPIIKHVRGLSLAHQYDLAFQLWDEPYREAQYVAMDILACSERKIDLSNLSHTQSLIETKSWWDTVDWLASHLIGQIFRGRSGRSEPILLAWLYSDNIWLNRTCLLYQLFYRGDTDFNRLCDYIMVLQAKKEFFIQKAIGWALRQYSKTDPIAVEKFVKDHPELSNLAHREAVKHIKRNR